MLPTPSDSLLAAFRQFTDPRHRRGARHPLPGLMAVLFLGLLSRHPDFASIGRWAKRHWPVLQAAFGLTRAYAPHPTTPAGWGPLGNSAGLFATVAVGIPLLVAAWFSLVAQSLNGSIK